MRKAMVVGMALLLGVAVTAVGCAPKKSAEEKMKEAMGLANTAMEGAGQMMQKAAELEKMGNAMATGVPAAVSPAAQ